MVPGIKIYVDTVNIDNAIRINKKNLFIASGKLMLQINKKLAVMRSKLDFNSFVNPP